MDDSCREVNCGGKPIITLCLRSFSVHGIAWDRDRFQSLRVRLDTEAHPYQNMVIAFDLTPCL